MYLIIILKGPNFKNEFLTNYISQTAKHFDYGELFNPNKFLFGRQIYKLKNLNIERMDWNKQNIRNSSWNPGGFSL